MKAIVNGTLLDVAAPAAPQAARPGRPQPPIPGIDFLGRFTLDEYAGIHAAAASSPQLAYWMDMVRVQSSVTVGSETASQARAYLVASGLLTQQRADAIFS